MSSLNLVSPDSSQDPATRSRNIHPGAVAGAMAITLFLAAEIYVAAAAAVWGAAGLFHMDSSFALTLYLLALILATLAVVKVAKLAWSSETDPENNR